MIVKKMIDLKFILCYFLFMKYKEDKELIELVKNNDNEALKELIYKYTPAAYVVFRKYARKMQEIGISNALSFEDKDIIIYNTAKSFNFDKRCKFISWLYQNVRFYCLNTMKASREMPYEDGAMNTIIESRRDLNKDSFDLNISYVNSLLEQFKDKRIKKIFQLRYFEHPSKNWQEIGAEMKLSHTTCVILHNKAKEILKKKLLSTANFDKI